MVHPLRRRASLFGAQVTKAAVAVRSPQGRRALRLGVAAAGSHQALLHQLQPAFVIDVGANRGQFALDVRAACPSARILSFEPLPEACEVYGAVFADDPRAKVVCTALGSVRGVATLHRSASDDSSSLLPIGRRQVELFPETAESSTVQVPVTTLDATLADHAPDLPPDTLLKLDVQGFELEVLRGAGATLCSVRWVYVECSFERLYDGQALAYEVIEELRGVGHHLVGIGDVMRADGSVIQADLLFSRPSGKGRRE